MFEELPLWCAWRSKRLICLKIFPLDVLKDLLIWGAWRYALQMCSKTYSYNVLEDLPFWCIYLDVHCWWRMSSNFVVFYFLFEWNQPVNHHMPLEINPKFFLPNLKSKWNFLWFCGQWLCMHFDFLPANNVMQQISPPPFRTSYPSFKNLRFWTA